MSDQGKYRKTYLRLWRHPGFTQLTDGEKVVALYVLTGPQSNRLGLYLLSIATAAEDLGTVSETLKKRLVAVCQTFGWLFDPDARVIYIPSWFRWNPPENMNVMKGSLKDLNEIPPCGLIDAFARNIETLPETLRETFREGLRQRLPQGSRTQEQYQEQKQDQEQKPKNNKNKRQEPARGRIRAEYPEEALRTDDGKRREEPSPRHVELARETLAVTNPAWPIDELIDAFGSLCASRSLPSPTRAVATQALAVALSESKQSTERAAAHG